MEPASPSKHEVPSVPQEEVVAVPVQVENEKPQSTDPSPESPKQEKTPSGGYEKADFMAKESVGKVMWKLTYPSVVAKVVSALYAVCDTVFISKMAGETEEIRSQALAAVSLAMPLEQGIIHSFVMMISNGGSTLYGQTIGEKNETKSGKVIGNTYFLEVIVAILLAAIMPFVAKPLLYCLGASDSAGTLLPGYEYISVLFYGSICYAFSMASADLIRGQGSALVSCAVSMTSAILNIIGDPFYIKVCGLGVAGASLSTVLANLVSAVIGFFFMCSKRAIVPFKLRNLTPDCSLDKSIAVTGLSGFVSGFAGAFVTLISNKLVLHYSKYPADDPRTTTVLGAWGALSKIYFVSFVPLIALAQGVMPLLAFSAGARLHKRFMRCAKLTLMWMIGITVVLEIVILLFTKQIAHLFSYEDDFVSFFVPATRVVVSGVFLQPLVMTVFPMLQAVGKGGLAGMLLAMKTCVIPLLLQLGFSAIMDDYWGAVYSYPVVEVISALLAVALYLKNKSSFAGELPVVAEKTETKEFCVCLAFTVRTYCFIQLMYVNARYSRESLVHTNHHH